MPAIAATSAAAGPAASTTAPAATRRPAASSTAVTRERALTWTEDRGFTHRRVDDGEREGDLAHKATPVLMVDGAVDHRGLAELLEEEGGEIDPAIVRRVGDRLASYPLVT